MLRGAKTIRMHGQDIPFEAEVFQIEGLSAHADYQELTTWLAGLDRAPSHVFITHGEPPAAEAFRAHLDRTFGWRCEVPSLGDWTDLAHPLRRAASAEA